MTGRATRGSDADEPADTGAVQRGRREQLLIVGPDPLEPGAGARLARPVLHASNLFEAIGSIGNARSGEPVGAALVRSELIPSAASHVAAAIRRLDPSITLVRVVGADDEDPLPTVRGFDHVVRAPIDATTLAAVLGPRWIEPGPADEATAPEPEAPDFAAPPPPPEPAAVPAPSDADLGDTDLVDAVMHDPGGVRHVALALARQQTGWNDLDLVEPQRAGADVRGAEVRTDERVHGLLVSGQATGAELESWARWLARWLALDAAFRDYRLLAYRDDLTGAWNRRYFRRFLADAIAVAQRRRRPVSVMVFDIDDFKQYNDRYGHDAGDVILRETVALLNSVIRSCDRVCRIGGDEFAVIFADLDQPRETGSSHPASVEQLARRFQEQVCTMRFPKLGLEAPGKLSISGGLATYPWDGSDPADLLVLADHRALESKKRGKNHLTFGPGGAESS